MWVMQIPIRIIMYLWRFGNRHTRVTKKAYHSGKPFINLISFLLKQNSYSLPHDWFIP